MFFASPGDKIIRKFVKVAYNPLSESPLQLERKNRDSFFLTAGQILISLGTV